MKENETAGSRTSRAVHNTTGFRSTEDIIGAFEHDGYEVIKIVEYEGVRGFMAKSKTAFNYETGEHKLSYYVEGTSFQMGYLMGLLAPRTVERMAVDYVYNFIPCMLKPNGDPEKFRLLWKVLWCFISLATRWLRRKYPKDIPAMYAEEMKGLVAGCKKATNGNTKVTFNKLWNLNTSFDLILSLTYTNFGMSELERYVKKRLPWFNRTMIMMPAFCNGFSVFGAATASGNAHYFGRDFMLSTGNVLEFTAAMIIYNPVETFDGRKAVPFVSMAAPGFVGSLAAMNNYGIGIGVNTVPAANCAPCRPGINSVLLVRHCAQYSQSAQEAVSITTESQRGVSWLYIVADGTADKAVVIECGKKETHTDFLSYIPDNLKKLLPDQAFLKAHPSDIPQQMGLMQRWNDYRYPQAYMSFNKPLFEHFNKPYTDWQFSEKGYVDKKVTDTGCPFTYYFSPQREDKNDLLLVTNMYIIPEIRLAMMNAATVKKANPAQAIKIAKTTYDDVQWRYDVLNEELLNAYGNIDLAGAKDIISFLRPDGKYPDYTEKNPTSSDGKVRTIQGTISLCDLKKKVMESHYGYYADAWLKLTLPQYL